MLKFIAFVFILLSYAKYTNQTEIYCETTKGIYYIMELMFKNRNQYYIDLRNEHSYYYRKPFTRKAHSVVKKRMNYGMYYNVTIVYPSDSCPIGTKCRFRARFTTRKEDLPPKNVPPDFVKDINLTVSRLSRPMLKVGDTITFICKGSFVKLYNFRLLAYKISYSQTNRLYGVKNLGEWKQYGCKWTNQELIRNITITPNLHNKDLICGIENPGYRWGSKEERYKISINHFGASYRMNNITGPTDVNSCNKIRLKCSCIFENKQYPRAGASLISLTWLESGKPVAETSNIDKKGQHVTRIHDNDMDATYKEDGNIAWSVLTIKRPRPCHTYNFSCRVEASGHSRIPLVLNKSLSVEVQRKSQQPTYMYVPQKTYYEGHNFTITCTARSDCLGGFFKLFILRNNALEERLKIYKTSLHPNCSQSVSSLYIFSGRDHLSRFRCDYISMSPTSIDISKLITVESLVKQAQILIDNNIVLKTTYEIVEGREYDLKCHANSYPEPLYKWAYKSDIMNEKVFISRSEQIFRQFKRMDRGAYWCEATNTLSDGRSTTVRSPSVYFYIIDPMHFTQSFEEQDSPTAFWIVYLVILVIIYCFIVGAFIHHYDPAHRAPRRQRQHMD